MPPCPASPPPHPPPESARQDHNDWLRMWRKGHIDFHQHKVNPLLRRFWHTLAPPAPARVFVPLCGKSLDLLWLAAQGYEVVGVELSPVAVKAFFDEGQLKPRKHKRGKLTRHETERITLLCGDFFRLSAEDLGHIDAVYDRAALTALPEALRTHYVAHLRRIVPPDCHLLLLTIADADPPPTPAAGKADARVDAEIRSLYTRHFHIDMAHREPGTICEPANAAPTAVEYTVYRLAPKPDP